jgi:hypothetical protein
MNQQDQSQQYSNNVPKSTPCGQADVQNKILDGVWDVSTPGHGGIWLSRERVAALPEWVNKATIFTGSRTWYEEDCDWCIPVVAFASEIEQLERVPGRSHCTGKQWVEFAKETLLHNHWRAYEEAFRTILTDGMSRSRDTFVFEAIHREHYLGASFTRTAETPPGYLVVTGRREHDGSERYWLVKEEEYDKRYAITKADHPTLLVDSYRFLLGKPTHIPCYSNGRKIEA